VSGTSNAPANNATVGAIFGTNISGGSTSTNYINNNGYLTTVTGNSITTGTMNAARINGGDINGVTITGVVITGGTVRTSSSGKRVVMTSDKIEIYNSSSALVGTFEGIAGTYASAIDASVIHTSFIGFKTDAIGDPFALGANFDGAIGSRTGGVFLSGRLDASGGGDPIELIPATDQGIICYGPIIFSGETAHPTATEGSFYYNSTDKKLYFRTNAAWVEVATA
jgi:hypothetical protein